MGKQSRYTKKGINTDSSQQAAAQALPSWSLYQHLTELPLSRWIDLTVDGNTSALIKSGTPPADAIADVEGRLRVQYADAMGDHEYITYVNVMREITMLQATLTQIESLIAAMREVYNPVLAKALNKLLHASLVLDVTKPEEYDKNLDRAFRRSRSFKMRLDMKGYELKKIELKYMNGVDKLTREYYYGLLLSLSDHAGFPVTESISVWEFCERIKRANKSIEAQNHRKRLGR
jgi:hypothetical protein